MKQLLPILFAICSISSIAQTQTTLYIENFDNVSFNGKGQNGATFDVTGIANWTLDMSGAVSMGGSDHFMQTNGVFESFNTDATSSTPVYWYSTVIDITGYTNVSGSVSLSSISPNSASGTEAFYRIDGGSWVSFGFQIGTLANTIPTFSGLTGSSIEIRVAHWGTDNLAFYRHDDVIVQGSTPTQQIDPSDDCAGIPTLPVTVDCEPIDYVLDGAYIDGGLILASCFSGVDTDDGWYQFVATSSDIVIQLTCDRATTLAVYGTCAGGPELGCAVETNAQGGSIVLGVSGLSVGTTYYIQVHRNSGANSTMFGTICLTPNCAGDVDAPTGTAPADINVQCIGDVPAPDVSLITDEADNCTLNPSVIWLNDVAEGNSCPETITRTYRISDNSQNYLDVVQIITVNDTQAPTGSAPANITVSSLPAFDVLEITDEADNCGTPVVSFVSDVSDGNTCPEIFTRTYSITDDCGNATNVQQLITIQPSLPTATVSGGGTVCSGDVVPDISITLTGSAPWSVTYSDGTTPTTVSPVSSPYTIAGATDGSYVVTVVSDQNCTGTSSGSASIVTNPLPTATISGGGTVCSGDAIPDISIALTGNGPWSVQYTDGTSNYWVDPITSPYVISGGMDGTYLIISVDDQNCTGTSSGSGTITTNFSPLAPTVSADATYCLGDAISDLTASGSGGMLNWYDDAGLTNLIANGGVCTPASNIGSSTYYVTETAAGCTGSSAQVTVVIQDCATDPCLGIFSNSSALVINPTCENDADGSIDLTVSGGQSPYTYQWGRGYTTEDISNLQAGTYTVLISDANGCDTTLSFVLQPQSVVGVTVATTGASCGNEDGSATANVTSGTSPYSYSFTSGDTISTAQNLAAGMYNVTVTDVNGCSASSTFTISDSDGPSISINSTEPTCPSDADGAIDLTITGGTSPYTYSWSDGSTTEDLLNLSAGTYDIEVADANGCTAMNSISLTGGAPIALGSFTLTNPSCGNSDGQIAVNATGGNGTLTYQWGVNAGNQTTATATGLGAGGFYLTVTDNNGCAATQGYMLSNSNAPTVAVQSNVPVACDGSGGDVDVVISGGVPSFVYSWNNGSTTQDLTGVAIGVYDLEVTDGNGCMAMLSVEVEGAEPSMQSICMVTVDSITGTNLLVWEKPVTPEGIAYYSIYREGSAAGVFSLVDTLHYSSLSQWTDPIANPVIRGWRYKISATDSCGNESPLSLYHKTIHLTVNLGVQNDFNLIWDDYVGLNMPTWYIERYHATTGWKVIDSIPSNLHSYTDITVPTSGLVLYAVYGVPSGGCTSTKAQDHNSTRSNRGNIMAPVGTGIIELNESAITVYPNPTKGMVYLVSEGKNSPFTVEIYDLQGRHLDSKTCNSKTESINISGYESGVYIFKVTSEGSVNEIRVVKN